jgi:hypothetical protein
MAMPRLQPPEVAIGHEQTAEQSLDSQALAALGAACIDHSAAATCFHANQKAVGTGATCLGWLVGTLHGELSKKETGLRTSHRCARNLALSQKLTPFCNFPTTKPDYSPVL